MLLKYLTLKMASAQVVETSVTNNSPSQDSYHPDDLFQSRYATPGFKPFSYLKYHIRFKVLSKGTHFLIQIMTFYSIVLSDHFFLHVVKTGVYNQQG